MLDDLMIMAIGGMVICVIVVVAELIAKWIKNYENT